MLRSIAGVLVAGLIWAIPMQVDAQQQTLNIAVTPGDPDLARLQQLSDRYLNIRPDVRLNWVVMDRDNLVGRLQVDAAAGQSELDVVSLTNGDVLLTAGANLLLPDVVNTPDGISAAALAGVSIEGKTFGAPFAADVSAILYHKGMLENAGLQMPESPTWDQIGDLVAGVDGRASGAVGFCPVGGRGTTDAFDALEAIAGSYGADSFTMEGRAPNFRSEGWRRAIRLYKDLMAGNAQWGSAEGIDGRLMFLERHCAIWLGYGRALKPEFVGNTDVADVGAVLLPADQHGTTNVDLWTQNLAIPAASLNVDVAKEFVTWATSKDYAEMVAAEQGWPNAPLGGWVSLYDNPELLNLVPIAEVYKPVLSSEAVRPLGRERYQQVALEFSQLIAEAVAQGQSDEEIIEMLETLSNEYRIRTEGTNPSIDSTAPQSVALNVDTNVSIAPVDTPTTPPAFNDEGWPLLYPKVEGITRNSLATPSLDDVVGDKVAEAAVALDDTFAEGLVPVEATGRIPIRFFRGGFPDAVLIRTGGTTPDICTGTMLTGRFVLTVEHCATNFEQGGAVFVITGAQHECVGKAGKDIWKGEKARECGLVALSIEGPVAHGPDENSPELALIPVAASTLRWADIRGIYKPTVAMVTFTGFGLVADGSRDSAGVLEVTWDRLTVGGTPANLGDSSVNYGFSGVTSCGGDSGGAVYLGRVFGYSAQDEVHELIGVVTAGSSSGGCTPEGKDNPASTYVVPLTSSATLKWLCETTANALTICTLRQQGQG